VQQGRDQLVLLVLPVQLVLLVLVQLVLQD
jgi:hypothetical protein